MTREGGGGDVGGVGQGGGQGGEIGGATRVHLLGSLKNPTIGLMGQEAGKGGEMGGGGGDGGGGGHRSGALVPFSLVWGGGGAWAREMGGGGTREQFGSNKACTGS